MSDFASSIGRQPKISIKTIIDDIKDKGEPDQFVYNGSQMFHGMQGEGKTVSMYHYGMKAFRKFKRSMIVTNLKLSYMQPVHINNIPDLSVLFEPDAPWDWRRQYIYVESFDDVMRALKSVRNGIYGVIFMIDEIHTYFHSHDSKSMPMWVSQVFSMQRKQHLVVLGTVQDWEDLVKIIRKQARNLILCHKISYFITQTVVDPRSMETEYGESFFPVKKKGYFFLSKEIRDGMDTFQVIDSGRSIMGGQELANGIQKNKNGTIIRPGQKRFRDMQKLKSVER